MPVFRNVRSLVGELSFDFHISPDDDESSGLMSTVRQEDSKVLHTSKDLVLEWDTLSVHIYKPRVLKSTDPTFQVWRARVWRVGAE